MTSGTGSRQRLREAIKARTESGADASAQRKEMPATLQQIDLMIQIEIEGYSSRWHLPLVLEFSGRLDLHTLEAAMRHVAARHPALLSIVMKKDEEYMQAPCSPPDTFFRALPVERATEALDDRIRSEIDRPFDMQKGPLIRGAVFRAPDRDVLVLIVHHAISDGWSMRTVQRELGTAYTAISAGRQPQLPKPGLYTAYARSQRSRSARLSREAGLEYWRATLEGAQAPNLPFAALESERTGHEAHIVRFEVGGVQTHSLERIAAALHTTPFVVLLTAYTLLLSEFSGSADVCLGATVANRDRSEWFTAVGLFAGLVLIRSRLDLQATTEQLVRQVAFNLEQASKHYCPLGDVLRAARIDRDPRRPPLFAAHIDYEDWRALPASAAAPDALFKGMPARERPDIRPVAMFDLSLYCSRHSEGLDLYLVSRRDRFPKAEVSSFGATLVHLLESLETHLNEPLFSHEHINREQQAKLQYFSMGRAPISSQSSIGGAFTTIARLQPDDIAVECGKDRLTYQELDEQSNQLAHLLSSFSLAPGTCVGVILEAQPSYLIALLAILKIGCAYAPLDPHLPEHRKAGLIKDAQIPVVITGGAEQGWLQRLTDLQVSVVDLQELAPLIVECSTEQVSHEVPPETPAYVMFTSGSTGLPKGVLVPHRAVLRLAAEPDYLNVTKSDVFLHAAPPSFDASTFEVWTALLNGARVALPGRRADILDQLPALIGQHGVTVLWLTAGLFREVINTSLSALAGLRYLLAGGDVLPPAAIRAVTRGLPAVRLLNGYGPTETTTFATVYSFPEGWDGTSAPIGRPIQGTCVYVLDQRGRRVPIGAIGELCIGGPGVAVGYLGRPRETAEKFIPDPFATERGARMYRTGDMGYWAADGTLRLIGRTDNQLKIRGYRVEPEEIEAVMTSLPGIRSGVVVPKKISAQSIHLAAYWCPTERLEAERVSKLQSDLLQHLQSRLPAYMVPGSFHALEELPLTASGKVDRRALAERPLPLNEGKGHSDEEWSPVQRQLREAWASVFGHSGFQLDDSFFGVGGDSLLALRLKAAAAELGLHLEVSDILHAHTLREQAVRVEERAAAGLVSAGPHASEREVTADFPLASLQTAMLLQDILGAKVGTYHPVTTYTLRLPLDAEQLRCTLDYLSAKYDVLRLSFHIGGDTEPFQRVNPAAQIPLEIRDLTGMDIDEQRAISASIIEGQVLVPFSIDLAPLSRVIALKCAPEKWLLVWNFHHAIIDGWSEATLFADFLRHYTAGLKGEVIAPAPAQRPFAEVVHRELASLTDASHLQFWKSYLSGFTPLNLPQLIEGPGRSTTARLEDPIAAVECSLDPRLQEGLREFARRSGVPLKSVLLSGHLLALRVATGQTDVTTAVVTHMRPDEAAGEELVGLYLNCLPVRLSRAFTDGQTLVQSVFRDERDLYSHRFFPAQRIREEMGGAQLYSTLFNFTHFHVLSSLDEATKAVVESRDSQNPTDFAVQCDFFVSPLDGSIGGRLSYPSGLLSQRYAKDLAAAHIQAYKWIIGQERDLTRPPWVGHAVARWEAATTESAATDWWQHIEAYARKHPSALAITEDGASQSYGALVARARRISQGLQQRGVGSGDVVAAELHRSTDLLTLVLALLDIGATYLPLDIGIPVARRKQMLRDSRPALLVSAADSAPDYSELSIARAAIADLDRGETTSPAMRLVNRRKSAYLLYTSGSTGKPKGVLSSMQGLSALHATLTRVCAIGEGDRVLWKTSTSFDVSLTEMLFPLAVGAAVVVAPLNAEANPEALVSTIQKHAVTVVNFVPSMLHAFLVHIDVLDLPLKAVIAAGEALLPATMSLMATKLPRVALYNAYGPTEATIYASVWKCDPAAAERVLMGRAAGDARLYVLSPDGTEVPAGIVGELHIGGAAVAQGYLNQSRLTAERFIPDSMSSARGGRLYRTGDLVRVVEDGQLEFVGRKDAQVKVRGYRIELGDVEAALCACPGVRRAAVVLRRAGGYGEALWAFVEAAEQKLDKPWLLRQLKARLPPQMVPQVIHVLDVMPVTASGKIDRAALNALHVSSDAFEGEPSACGSDLEEQLLGVWRKVIGADVVGKDVNFFDAGGTSLSLLRAHQEIRAKIAPDIEVAALFSHTTVRQLAAFLQKPKAASQATKSLQTPSDAIAVIGASLSTPGAADLEEFWTLVAQGRDAIRRPECNGQEAVAAPSNFVAAEGELADAFCFDGEIFGYTPREAQVIDPQQRRLMEESYRALVAAGVLEAASSETRVGVFVGTAASLYLHSHVLSNHEWVESIGTHRIGVLNQPALQLAYRLGLRGPAITIQTACSTSLVCVHMACRSLLDGECDVAVAGGAAINPGPTGYFHTPGDILSADGYCRPFDEGATGTVPGNGAAVVVLKRLEQAIEARDPILGVIRGSAVNNDGNRKVGYAAPSVEGQIEVINEALRRARVDPASVEYVEAHGTGTALGDVVEAAGLRATYGNAEGARRCVLGSLKANIGHLDAAAGAAGLIKALLALSRGIIPGTAHFKRSNSRLALETSRLIVSAAPESWSDQHPRRAGVSSFGIGGTNAHVILEEPPDLPSDRSAWDSHVLIVSERSPESLRDSCNALATWLTRHDQVPLADVAYTLQARRPHRKYRRFIVADSLAQASDLLRLEEPALRVENDSRRIVFMFPGQGTQYLGMAGTLYAQCGTFKESFEAVLGHAPDRLAREVRELFVSGKAVNTEGEAQDTLHVQVALFAFEYALTQVLAELGVRPDYVVGHSLGEITAAVVAGVMSTAEALRLIAARASAMSAQDAAGMLAIFGEEDAVGNLPDGLWMAARNSLREWVVAGHAVAIEELAKRLHARGVEHSRLASRHAFHTPLMAHSAKEIERALANIELKAPSIPIASGLHGRLLADGEVMDRAYWARQVMTPVLFHDAIEDLFRSDPSLVWVDVGPAPLLGKFVKALDRDVAVVPTLSRSARSFRDLLTGYGRILCLGGRLARPHMYGDELRRGVHLPPPVLMRQPIDHMTGSMSKPVVTQETAEATKSSGSEERFAAIRREVEAVWRDCFGMPNLTDTDDYFEIGGDSLLAGRIAARLRERLILTVEVSSILDNPTIARLATALSARVAESKPSGSQPIEEIGEARSTAPLSPAQYGIWLTERLGRAGGLFNLTECIALSGALDVAALQSSLAALLWKHGSLRVIVRDVDEEEPEQILLDAPDVRLESVPCSPGNRQETLAAYIQEESERPFVLNQGPLVRFRLLRFSDLEHVLILTIHHLIVDGRSWQIIARDLAMSYSQTVQRRPLSWTADHTYLAYAAQQNERARIGWYNDQLAYWMERLRAIPELDGLISRARPATLSLEGHEHQHLLSQDHAREIDRICQQRGVTPYILFLAAFWLALHARTRQSDFGIGSPVSGRRESRWEGVVGFFVNLVVLRIDTSAVRTIGDFIESCRRTALEALDHQDCPFSLVRERLSQGGRRPNRAPIFQVMMSMQEEPTRDFACDGIGVHFEPVAGRWAEYDLTLNVHRSGNTYAVVLQYAKALFDDELIATFTAGLQRALQGLLGDPEHSFHELTHSLDPKKDDLDVYSLIGRHLISGNSAPAVCCDGETLSYEALAANVDELAARLALEGVVAGEVVAIDVVGSRLPAAIVACLAILRQGAAFVFMERDRAHEHARQAGACVVLTNANGEWRVESLRQAKQAVRSGRLAAAPAYVVLTSGTTGAPKAVLVSSAELHGRIIELMRAYELQSSDRVLQFASPVFDVWLEETLASLAAGCCIVSQTSIQQLGFPQFAELLAQRGVTVANLPASYWAEWTQHISAANERIPQSLRLLIVGSERVAPEAWRIWMRMGEGRVQLLNAYGASETVITSLLHRGHVADGDAMNAVPIGQPLPGVHAYVLNNSLEEVPSGQPGELYIGGTGLAYGYAGLPRETASRFIPDPYTKAPGMRMFKTGDIVHRSGQGDLVFRERTDRQVKLRGRRLELEDIEWRIGQCPLVRAAAVRMQPRAGTEQLIAYVLAARPEISLREIREWLQEHLPRSLVPARLRLLDALPRTAGGKIDERALALLEADESESAPAANPDGAHARTLLAVIADVFGNTTITLDQNFFEIGGDSVLVLRCMSKLGRAGYTVEARAFFESRTLAEIAKMMRLREPQTAVRRIEAGGAPSPFMKALIDAGAPELMSRALHVQSATQLDAKRLHRAVSHLLSRHPALRYKFSEDYSRGSPMSWEDLDVDSLVSTVDLSALRPAQRDRAIAGLQPYWHEVLDPRGRPLVHFVHYRGAPGAGDVLLILAHSLVADAHSWSIMISELERAYHSEASIEVVNEDVFGAHLRNLKPPQASAVTNNWNGRQVINVEGAVLRSKYEMPSGTLDVLMSTARSIGVPFDHLAFAVVGTAVADLAGHEVDIDFGHNGRDLQDAAQASAIGCFSVNRRVSVDPGLDMRDPQAITHLSARVARAQSGEAPDSSQKAAISFDVVRAGEAYPNRGFTLHPQLGATSHHPAAPRTHLLNVIAEVAGSELSLRYGFVPGCYQENDALCLHREIAQRLQSLTSRLKEGQYADNRRLNDA
jgi:amino acid adenylation domain-containing protein